MKYLIIFFIGILCVTAAINVTSDETPSTELETIESTIGDTEESSIKTDPSYSITNTDEESSVQTESTNSISDSVSSDAIRTETEETIDGGMSTESTTIVTDDSHESQSNGPILIAIIIFIAIVIGMSVLTIVLGERFIEMRKSQKIVSKKEEENGTIDSLSVRSNSLVRSYESLSIRSDDSR